MSEWCIVIIVITVVFSLLPIRTGVLGWRHARELDVRLTCNYYSQDPLQHGARDAQGVA